MKIASSAIEYTTNDHQIFENLMMSSSSPKLSSRPKKKTRTLLKARYSDQDLEHFDNIIRGKHRADHFSTRFNLTWPISTENSPNIKIVEFDKQPPIDSSRLALSMAKVKIKYFK